MTEAPPETDPSREEKAAARLKMFPEGGPDVAIGMIDVIRSTIVSEAGRDREDSIRWQVSMLPTGGNETPAVLMGDLGASKGGWFVGVTVIAYLAFRDGYDLPDLQSPEALSAFNQVLGPWATNMLYDVAAIQARQLIAAGGRARIEIPIMTPETQYA